MDVKLEYHYDPNAPQLETYVDADWGTNEQDRKSTTGFVIKVHNCPVIWLSKKQPIVALSSTEAEYVAATSAVQEVCWLRKILVDLFQPPLIPTPIHEDNQGAINMSKNPETKRTKHMDIRFHYLRDCVENGVVQLQHIPTRDQIADIFTKALPRPQFEALRSKLMSGSVRNIS